MKKLVLAFTGLLLAVTIPSAQAQTFTPLHNFTGETDGAFPKGALVRDADGNLYGTTNSGGIGQGTVFKIDSTGEETILLAFDAFVSGGFPASGLVQDEAGNLYGIADEGPGGAGVVFKVSPEGEETLLQAFQGGFNRDPKVPTGGILIDQGGGSEALGTVFVLSPAGQLEVLHSFEGLEDGAFPVAGVVRDAAGNLYGTAVRNFLPPCPEPG